MEIRRGKENYNSTAGLTYQVPLLLLDRRNTHLVADSTGEYYSLRNGKTHKLSLAETNKSFNVFSSLGWLITVSEDLRVNLLHPLYHHPMVKLPNLIMYKRNGAQIRVIWQKFALSSSPSTTSDYVVMAIHINRLSFCTPGDDGWTMVDKHMEYKPPRVIYLDITYHEGQFFIVNHWGQVLVCDIEDPNQARTRVIFDSVAVNPHYPTYYLVESRGVLLAVECYTRDYSKIFEVSFKNGIWSDSEVTDLGNRSLFLGRNSSFSVEASTFSRFKTNCIYFAYHNSLKPNLFSMEDKKMDTYMDDNSNISSLQTPYLWIQPSF